MNIAVMIASVAAITELIKTGLLRIRIDLKGIGAFVLAVVVSAGVVTVETLKMGSQFTFKIFTDFLQVAIGSTMGYAILTKKGENKNEVR